MKNAFASAMKKSWIWWKTSTAELYKQGQLAAPNLRTTFGVITMVNSSEKPEELKASVKKWLLGLATISMYPDTYSHGQGKLHKVLVPAKQSAKT